MSKRTASVRGLFILALCAAAFCISSLSYAGSKKVKGNKTIEYVDPFIGTGGHGHTYPGASVPYGMVQPGPDNGRSGWDWCSGYHYSDSLIAGFSQTHLSGTGCGDLCDILITPVVNRIPYNKAFQIDSTFDIRSRFSHNDEKAEAGYYSVLLKEYNIKAELTASERCAFHKYTFPSEGQRSIVLDLGYAVNWDQPVKTRINIVSNTEVSGYRYSRGWAKDEKIFFVIRFSQPFIKFSAGSYDSIAPGRRSAEGALTLASFAFDEKLNEPVKLKIGISFTGIEGAMRNLDTEIPGWDFDKTRTNAARLWEKELSKIEVKTSSEDLKTVFYTAMYHSMLAPVIISDTDGSYRGADGKIHTAKGMVNYSTFSLWDTFRALHPLMTIISPEYVPGWINSMLSFYKEYGLLPDWPLVNNETNTMIGIHALPVIADACMKGIKGFDYKLAYEAMRKTAMQQGRGLDYFRSYNFIPADKEKESVSKTLEYCYDFWCLAGTAKLLGRNNDYELFSRMSGNYRNLHDTTSGFFRGRLSDGTWRTPFDPLSSDHRNDDFTEGNAWHYYWFVPHNADELIQLSGGNESFVRRLDSLFSIKEAVKGENVSPDISGLIGQYAHGNEPCHHIAYLYNYAGRPDKTAERVREISGQMYKTGPEGLPGNEDCGQMSAWFIFSAMGFYPVNPAGGDYALGFPLFDEVRIRTGSGRILTIKAEGLSAGRRSIQSVTLNGRKKDRFFISHSEINQGGTLSFIMK